MKTFNKVFTMFMVIMTIGISTLEAQTIVIGTASGSNGTTTASPINIWYRSLRYQTVYTAAELTAAGANAGSILQIGFDVTGVPIHALPNYTIQMKHTIATDASTHDGTGLMQVYNTASYVPTAGGFDMLTLQTPFSWNGTDNILIDICFDQVTNFDQSGTVSIFSATNGARYIVDDNSSQCGATTGSTLGEKPVIQMVLGTPPACSMTSLPTFTNITTTTADASWTPTGTPVSYIVEYGLNGFTPGTGTSVSVTTPNYSMSALSAASDYTFRVQAVCGTAVGDTSFAAIGYFSTSCPATLTAPFTESFAGAGLACMTTANGNLTSGGGFGNIGWNSGGGNFYTAPNNYDGDNFLYFETQGANAGQSDTLYFLPIDLSPLAAPFMDFYWYLDYGFGSGSFSVDIQDASGNWTTAVSKSDDQNINDWSYAAVDLSSYANTTIGLRIVGTALFGFDGGASIDRLRVKEAPASACSIQASPLVEDFESAGVLNACWEQSTMDSLDWTIQTGPTGTTGTGPSGAANGSYYAYLESSSPVAIGDFATLMSPPINTATLADAPAIYFNYHMFGNDSMILRVEYEIFGSNSWETVWEQVGQVQSASTDDFEAAYIPLPNAIGASIRIRFTAIAGANGAGSTFAWASDIAIDDVEVKNVLANDVSITNIITGGNDCNLGLQPVTVEVTNRGFVDKSNVPVFVSINGSTAIGTSTGNIVGNGGVSTVDVMVDMSNLGHYDIQAFTVIPNDEVTSNDTASSFAYHQPQITGEYSEEYEMSNGYWYGEGSWEHGMPNGAIIDGAAGGMNAYVTNLTGNYADGQTSYLYSPCFDLSAMTQPLLRFSTYWDIEDNWDGAWLEYSIGGTGWTKLGANDLSGQNWYNDSITQNPLGWVWSGTDTSGNGSQGWVDAIIDLQPYGVTISQDVRFRFAMFSDGGTSNEGFGVDNFGIFDTCLDPVANATITNESVIGANDGAISLNPVAGLGGYTFAWADGTTTNTVSGLAPGTYDVTITDAQGCTSSTTFTVEQATCPADLGLTSATNPELGDNEANGAATVVATGGTAPYTYAWSNGDTDDYTNGLTGGNYDVTVTDANGCVDMITINVETTYMVGTENLEGLTGLLLSPNPAKDYAQLNINFENAVELSVRLVDVTGRVLETRNVGNTTAEEMRFDVSNLAEGVYFMQITANNKTATKRFVVVK